jgi:hypothetical protein
MEETQNDKCKKCREVVWVQYELMMIFRSKCVEQPLRMLELAKKMREKIKDDDYVCFECRRTKILNGKMYTRLFFF